MDHSQWPRHTPLAQTVEDSTVLGFQRALHDAELQRSVLRRVVDTVDRKFIGTESTGVVPGVVAGGRSGISAAAVDLADAVEVRVAVASEAVVDPDLRREAVVVLWENVSSILAMCARRRVSRWTNGLGHTSATSKIACHNWSDY